MGEEGSGAESDSGQSGKQKKSKPKRKSREVLERTQSQRFDVRKGGKEGHIAAECQERRRAAKSLRHVNDNKRQLWPEPCQAKQVLSTIVWKAPHQQVLEANQGDWQKELVVKGLVLGNCREPRGFLKWANHYCRFVKD